MAYFRILFALVLSFIVLSSATAGAGDYFPAKGAVVETAVIDDGFEFDFKFNGWLAQLNTNVSNSRIGYEDNIFIGLGDILGNLDWMLPVGADLRKGRVGFLPDIVAMKLSGASPTPRRLFARMDASLKLLTANLPFYYRVVDDEDLQLDLLAGARFLWVESDVTVSGGPLGRVIGSAGAQGNIQSWNAIAGIRAQQQINDKIFTSIYADMGTGEADLTWQVQADIGIRMKENMIMSVGYRYLTFDLSRRATNVGLTSSGPIIVTTWEF